MHHSMSLKREFLKKWKLCLQACNSGKDMTVTERKMVIKMSADVAMASTRHESTCWSRSVIREASSRNTSQNGLINKCVTATNCPRISLICSERIVKRSKKMFLRRNNDHNNAVKNKSTRRSLSSVKASCIAKRLVSKRRRVLKSLLPGGNDMDECSLIEEALDYIVSLRAQVDVMKCIANASLLLQSNK